MVWTADPHPHLSPEEAKLFSTFMFCKKTCGSASETLET